MISVKFSICGGANGDGVVEVSDVAYLISYLFIGGDPPATMQAGDVNLDDIVDSAAVVYLINYLFKGGPAPCNPQFSGFSNQEGIFYLT